MSLAIILVVIAQFLNAVVALVDKCVVSTRRVPQPSYYAFLISLLSALSIFVFLLGPIPLPVEGVTIPSFTNLEFPTLVVSMVSLLAGAAFFFALWTLFSALRVADASDVVPVVGAVSALAAFPLGHFLLGSVLKSDFLVGVFLLIIGTLLLSHFRFRRNILLASVLSGVFFALHFILLKYLFGITHFDNAFFWSRMGIVLAALIIFLPRWEYCKDCERKTNVASTLLIVGNKMLAGLASIIILKAIDLSDVSLVQALGGLQFVFLLGISVTVGHFLPKECGENLVGRNKIHKIIAISIIVAGFFFLFL